MNGVKTIGDIEPKKFWIKHIDKGIATVRLAKNIEKKDDKYIYDELEVEVITREDLEEYLDKYFNTIWEFHWNRLLQSKWNEVRRQRDTLLTETDHYIYSDYPITAELKDKIVEYRQKLRDIPNSNPDPFNVKFPNLPTE